MLLAAMGFERAELGERLQGSLGTMGCATIEVLVSFCNRSQILAADRSHSPLQRLPRLSGSNICAAQHPQQRVDCPLGSSKAWRSSAVAHDHRWAEEAKRESPICERPGSDPAVLGRVCVPAILGSCVGRGRQVLALCRGGTMIEGWMVDLCRGVSSV